MYLPLATADVWKIEGEFEASQLFKALPLVCIQSDILVIGSYRVGKAALLWLTAHEIKLSKEDLPFSDCFDLNRAEFPEGRFYGLHLGEAQMEELAVLSTVLAGGVDKDLFFDHLLVYRPGEPILPLLYFHDAFIGGTLFLSGHYAKQQVQIFAQVLHVGSELVGNPDFAKSS